MVQDARYFKDLLLTIYPCKFPFALVIKDDRPKKRLGTYYGKTRRIVLHSGWADKYSPIETAIHEYAHHLHYTEFGKSKKKQAPHGKEYWQIYGQLIWRAKMKGIYDDPSLPVLNFGESGNESLLLGQLSTRLKEKGSKTIASIVAFIRRSLQP